MGRKPRAEDYYAMLQRNRALAEELVGRVSALLKCHLAISAFSDLQNLRAEPLPEQDAAAA